MESIHVVWVWYLNFWGDAGTFNWPLSVHGPSKGWTYDPMLHLNAIKRHRTARSWSVPGLVSGLEAAVYSEHSWNQEHILIIFSSLMLASPFYHFLPSWTTNVPTVPSRLSLVSIGESKATKASSKVSWSMTMFGWSNNLFQRGYWCVSLVSQFGSKSCWVASYMAFGLW